MKVSSIMQKSIITITENTPFKEAARLIFSLGMSGIPVVKGKKLVGIITEEDILFRMHPTTKDLIEDYAHARNFEEMEKNLVHLLETSVGEVMNREVKTGRPDTPLMQAQSMMLLNKFSKLPIVNNKNELIGIISQGDIFREILKNEIPKIEREQYAGFIGRHYDLMVNWDKRFGYEFPILFHEFKKENIESVLDLGIWTGEYTIGLAKNGVERILGLDHNEIMIKMSGDKIKKLPAYLRKNIRVKLSDFSDLVKLDEEFDAAICMGNSLPYIPLELPKLFKEVGKVLRKKKAVIVLQVLNFEKILKKKDRLLSFIIQESHLGAEKEHLFIEFFDQGKNNYELLHHVIIFDNDGKNWIFKGVTTIPIFYYKKSYIEKILKSTGFKDIKFSGNLGKYQGEYGQLSFTEPFDPEQSDWLNVIAVRK